ncbi:phosphohistidine swiveling domain-containing protein [Bradyrhizobium sp. AZCC 1678]|uniref:PEP/pyruvate-binding domain-containing protein n=1 Tax=Bradyrhizobium sp. AZCC 1678 TaxID=3117030 RepID=UPI002FEECA39
MNMQILNSESAPQLIERSAGGKGRSLHALSIAKLLVPRWAIVPSDAWLRFARETGLMPAIDRILNAVEGDDFDACSKAISDLIAGAEFDAETSALIESAYEYVGVERVAVRSSGTDEDGPTHSYAGQFDSFLNLNRLEEVYSAVKSCWASNYSSRALSYRKVRGLALKPAPMAVIVQEMVVADVSGVAFTANPSTGATDEIVISAVPGLGEGLVSGRIDADTVTLDKDTYVSKTATFGERSEKVAAAEGSGIVTLKVEGEQGGLCITEDEAVAIAREALAAEVLYGCPQDLEWSIRDGAVYVLQSRPITTPIVGRRNGFGAHLWENSNITENFSGVTSPLTFSFARDVYHQIYFEYARLLGVPRKQLVQMNEWLRHMLGYHNGHVYYDLLSWYRVVRLVPFYSVNRRMLDLAIGVETALPEDSALQLTPMPGLVGWRSALARVKCAILFGWYFLSILWYVRAFVSDFHRRHLAVEQLPLQEMSAEQIHGEFRRVRIEFLSRWGRMILLEQTIGLSVGVLSVLVRRWLPNAGQQFLFDLMRPSEPLESMLPVARMTELAEQVRGMPEVMAIIAAGDDGEILQSLRTNDHPHARHFLRQVELYVAEFGYRSLNELKLEAPDLRERPETFFAMLRSHLQQPAQERMESGKTGVDAVLAGLPLWKRTLIRLTASKVNACLAARERVRFCRTRAFGSVRRMIKAMADDLVLRGMLLRPEDIFMTRTEELRDWADGVLALDDLSVLIAHRRSQQHRFEEMGLAPPRFVSSRFLASSDYPEIGWRNQEDLGAMLAEAGAEMRGTPCGGGRVKGQAAVISEPLNVPGKILVTYRTDPGWCAALPSVTALLIERGSPLTHVAIVARELGIPTIIQIKDLTLRIRTGAELEVDGSRGTVLVHSNAAAGAEAEADAAAAAVPERKRVAAN